MQSAADVNYKGTIIPFYSDSYSTTLFLKIAGDYFTADEVMDIIEEMREQQKVIDSENED